MLSALILAVAAATAAGETDSRPDEIAFEMLIAGGSPSGFRIDATERIETFDADPHRTPHQFESRQGEPGSFAKVAEQLSRYRKLADEGCMITPADVIAFRLTWREQGVLHAASFADSCKGIPTDLMDTIRPLAPIFEPERPAQDGVVSLELAYPEKR